MLQTLQHHLLVRPPAQDRFHDVRRQHRQPRDPADVALADLLRLGDLGDRAVGTGIEEPTSAPSPGQGQGLGQRAVRLRLCLRRRPAAVRHQGALAAAVPPEPRRDPTRPGRCHPPAGSARAARAHFVDAAAVRGRPGAHPAPAHASPCRDAGPRPAPIRLARGSAPDPAGSAGRDGGQTDRPIRRDRPRG
jgi:hypothetical protein